MATTLVQTERDALLFLGLLAYGFTRFDIPVTYPSEAAPSHVLGLNIFAAIVDNVDGELLALERNAIHAEGSPLQHGEQRALRTAIARVSAKRPRQPAQAIEGYYRSSMFMGPGHEPDDFCNAGATLYTTLEPCPMCASSALVARVKRVSYVLADHKYGGAWQLLKSKFYDKDEATYAQLALLGTDSPVTGRALQIHQELLTQTDQLRVGGIRDTHLLDFCRPQLEQAFQVLQALQGGDLASVTPDETRNATTLTQLQRALGMPFV
ncbi:nucleoside deaminase [Hymenobacter sp. BT491]|uniref:nucleoside deaminase n=1 Tax=Hymenobacter sp. BT491 TaxID=2766779 RepID=UPI001653AB6B|nr:nucleoside deaminase [Hymenobacter sp. BT491]MBC6992220.1 nucleoside deaminase [Hymenobacter sp. BT491]